MKVLYLFKSRKNRLSNCTGHNDPLRCGEDASSHDPSKNSSANIMVEG